MSESAPRRRLPAAQLIRVRSARRRKVRPLAVVDAARLGEAGFAVVVGDDAVVVTVNAFEFG